MTQDPRKFWEDPYEGNNWSKYIIEAPSHRAASREAANRNWWLHSWKWVEGSELRVYVNELYLINEIPNAKFLEQFKDKKWDGSGRNYRL